MESLLWDIIRQFNWVDILAVIVVARICYIAATKGFLIEIFKLSGALAAIYLPLHYFTILSDFVFRRVKNEHGVPLQFMDFFIFVCLSLLGYAIFFLIRSALAHFLKTEAAPLLNKWGGFLLGIARGVLTAGLIIFIFAISATGYFKNSVHASYLGNRFFNIAPKTYQWIWYSVASKFMVNEKFNPTVSEIQEDFHTE